MIQSIPLTLDQIYGVNFKRVPIFLAEMEGTNPLPINETDEDQYSEKNSREQQKRSLPPLQKVDIRVMVDKKRRRQNVHKSPVVSSQLEQHIGFRNSFYRNNKINLASRQKIEEIKNRELGIYTKYAQRFNVPKSQIWN
ncbi:unnamed protein product (macronuclear) [Paramecium tetraurelia]|uniref:Uncharacterized protein n=2 Tax=Paramecium TaxID=5884 RepID=A0BGQ4_PARTE|nr:uncharacterized protein GSPATT00028756001 [Paramecium tetraurelia]CAD8188593.1 unnamed protein product [Paramecium octaurelia]CAK57721.1 unnamed protein product [Paramecium tetraurelia]|eukprot:XP_001425119.1 hypothetical protein (macronuclear) [Paramecium tetraurelia strain d4-2]